MSASIIYILSYYLSPKWSRGRGLVINSSILGYNWLTSWLVLWFKFLQLLYVYLERHCKNIIYNLYKTWLFYWHFKAVNLWILHLCYVTNDNRWIISYPLWQLLWSTHPPGYNNRFLLFSFLHQFFCTETLMIQLTCAMTEDTLSYCIDKMLYTSEP